MYKFVFASSICRFEYSSNISGSVTSLCIKRQNKHDMAQSFCCILKVGQLANSHWELSKNSISYVQCCLNEGSCFPFKRTQTELFHTYILQQKISRKYLVLLNTFKRIFCLFLTFYFSSVISFIYLLVYNISKYI